MEEIIFRQATLEDAELLAELRLQFALELSGSHSETAQRQLRTQLKDFFSNSIAEGTSISWLALVDNDVAGIGSVLFRNQPGNFKNPSGRWGYIMNMYTLPEYRKRGIGNGILNRLMDSSHALGITAFELHATADGVPVYEKSGFSVHTEPTYRKFIL